jgi:hypothetical protein
MELVLCIFTYITQKSKGFLLIWREKKSVFFVPESLQQNAEINTCSEVFRKSVLVKHFVRRFQWSATVLEKCFVRVF